MVLTIHRQSPPRIQKTSKRNPPPSAKDWPGPVSFRHPASGASSRPVTLTHQSGPSARRLTPYPLRPAPAAGRRVTSPRGAESDRRNCVTEASQVAPLDQVHTTFSEISGKVEHFEILKGDVKYHECKRFRTVSGVTSGFGRHSE